MINQSNLPPSLQVLASRRKGGRVNFSGIEYQLLFAINKALRVFTDDNPNHRIDLEGLEDVDLRNKLSVDGQELHQLKFTSEPINASTLWRKGVLQNFAEAHLIDKQLKFVIVTNQPFRDGKLASLFDGTASVEIFEYWQNMFNQLKTDSKTRDWPWERFDLRAFLTKIQVQVVRLDTLRLENASLITQFYSLDHPNHSVYLNALFYQFFMVSRAGQSVDRRSLLAFGQQVQDHQAQGIVNPAVQHRLIERVNFLVRTDKNYTDYFDGQPALPVHVVAGLPVVRPKVEKTILKHINEFDVAILKASSGQGKSTLAWRVSYALHQQGQPIYQLHSCPSSESTGGVVNFLESRVTIGEAPVVVVDGLSNQHRYWATVASRLIDTPVRFIITTREEDWARYGSDAYSVRTGEPIKLEFTRADANQVFDELKRHKRLHPTAGHWQSAWETVYERGLLMEYVFMLTRGEMLAQRLKGQIARLNQERDGAVKLATLRLIATANDIGIPLLTRQLYRHLTAQFRPQTDIGELFRQLEAEYYVRFDQRYVEGLHPVRSRHLVELLHDYVPISDTLLELALLLEPTDWELFGKAIPQRIPSDERGSFFKSLVESKANTEAGEWVALLLGIYQGEVGQLVEQHRDRLDEVFQNGGYEFFAISTIPYPHEDASPISLIQQITETTDNPMIRAIRELPALPVEATSLQKIVPLIQKQLRQEQVSVSEMGELLSWFALMNVPVELPDDEELLRFLTDMEPELSFRIGVGLQALQPERFQDFASRHVATICHWLTRKTNSLSIVPEGTRIVITYLLTDDKHKDSNGESVSRIDKVHAWLPQYETYETNALVFPFPNEELTRIISDNAHKTLSPKMIFMPVRVRVNQSWNKILVDPYLADSAYSWQLGQKTIREKALTCVQFSCQLMERVLLRNSKGNSLGKLYSEWRRTAKDLLDFHQAAPLFPFKESESVSAGQAFKDQKQAISSWAFDLRNFVNQLDGLMLLDKPDTRRVALVNVRNAISHLPGMQKAFNEIIEQTHRYFDTHDLEKQELSWYNRLRRTAEFYAKHVTDMAFKPVTDVTATIAEHWRTKQELRFKILNVSLDIFAQLTGYSIYKPNRLLEEGLITEGVVGIEGLSAGDLANDFDWFATSLADVDSTDIDFLNVIFCQDRQATGGFRVNKGFLSKVARYNSGEDVSLDPSDNPYPINVTTDLISVLPEVSWQEPIPHPIGKPVAELYQTIWLFTETKRGMADGSLSEKDWKASQLNLLRREAAEGLRQIKQTTYTSAIQHIEPLYDAVLAQPDQWSGQQLAEHLLGTIQLLIETKPVASP